MVWSRAGMPWSPRKRYPRRKGAEVQNWSRTIFMPVAGGVPSFRGPWTDVQWQRRFLIFVACSLEVWQAAGGILTLVALGCSPFLLSIKISATELWSLSFFQLKLVVFATSVLAIKKRNRSSSNLECLNLSTKVQSGSQMGIKSARNSPGSILLRISTVSDSKSSIQSWGSYNCLTEGCSHPARG